MTDALRLFGQVVFYALFAALIGSFANRPLYQQFPADAAQIKLSFAHGAARKVACRRLTPEEIAKLPPRERRPNTCARERLPVHVQLVVDGVTIFEDSLAPTGFASDGPARVYRKFRVAQGRHLVVARLRDTERKEGFDYEKSAELSLKPRQNLAIDFKADMGGFIFE